MKLHHQGSGVALRKVQIEDRDQLVFLANNAKIANNLRNDFPHPYTIEDADNFIKSAQEADPTLRFCIEKDGVYVGNIGIHPQQDIYQKNAEIGYFIGEPYWGQGIASQAVKMIVAYGFEQLRYHRIYAGVFSYNTASKKVLENAGFTYEGSATESVYKNGQIFDELRYAILNPNRA
ncbi:MAG: GNAT family N-acetyltransferase [bacterium]|nr:GNAT family N-acetyltransferase [bacterium]